jgi:hypothetical protein
MDQKARWPRGRVALLALAVAVLLALAVVALRRFELPAFFVAGPGAEGMREAVVREPVVAWPLTGGAAAAPDVPACAGQLAFRAGDYAQAYGSLVLQSASDPSAAFLVGRMFAEGLAVPRNEEAAVRAFRSAAERGHRDAAYALALLHEGGRHSDFVQALHWYEQAALLGDAKAPEKLAWMYAQGTGTTVDPVRSAAWLDLVNEQHLSAGTAMPAELIELRRAQGDANKNNNAIAAAVAELRGRMAVARATYPGENNPCNP